MSTLIWGAGAIGGTIGAYLIEAGEDVTFVDTAADHVAAMRSGGLRIEGPIRNFSVPARAFLPTELEGRWQRVILATKSHHTATAASQLAPFLAEDGYVVSAQNGLNELEIAAVVGVQRTVGAFVNFGADYHGPGLIHYGGRGAVYIGELDGSRSERLEELHRLLLHFEPNTVLTTNINGYLWSKLAYGAMLFATALTNASIADVLAAERYQPLMVAIAREVLGIAELEGVAPESFDGFDPAAFSRTDVPAGVLLTELIDFNRRSTKTHSGIWRDLAVHRRKTEADAQLGPIVTTARRHGATAPLTDRIIFLVHEIEHGRLPQDWATLDRVASDNVVTDA